MSLNHLFDSQGYSLIYLIHTACDSFIWFTHFFKYQFSSTVHFHWALPPLLFSLRWPGTSPRSCWALQQSRPGPPESKTIPLAYNSPLSIPSQSHLDKRETERDRPRFFLLKVQGFAVINFPIWIMPLNLLLINIARGWPSDRLQVDMDSVCRRVLIKEKKSQFVYWRHWHRQRQFFFSRKFCV